MATDPHEAEHARLFGQLVAKSWTDEAFKQRLLAEPEAVLAEQGIEVPEGVQVRVVEDTDQVQHLVLPAKPAEGELSEEQLAEVGAGITYTRTTPPPPHCECYVRGHCHYRPKDKGPDDIYTYPH